jgi:4-hydroxy-tetrahydrodipicolinate synthase
MLYSAEFPDGFRAALQLRGINTGKGRQPKSDVQEQQLLQLTRQLQCLLAAEGFTKEPVGGCTVGEAMDPDAIARIVQGVVGELKKRGIA